MAEITEAACLLESGAIYTRRAGFQGATDPVFLGVKHGGFSLYFGDAPYFHFDLDGRWQRALIEGVHYLKSLDGAVQSIDRVREGANLVLKRRTLSYAETVDLDAMIRSIAIDLVAKANDGSYPRLEPPSKKGVARLGPNEAAELLERVAGWDASAWFAQREKYLAAYGPLPFVPPASSHPIVVQAAIGRNHGPAFGGGPTEPAAARSPEEFRRHVEQVAATLGRRASQSRDVLLAGDDLFHFAPDTIAAYLKAINDVFPIPQTVHRGRAADADLSPEALQLDGIVAFLDEFAPPLPSLDDWKRFRELNLKTVTLGVETALPRLRAECGRRWSDADLSALIRNLRGAGIEVSLAVVANRGGAEHLEATASLLRAVGPAKGEILYLLDYRELGGTTDLDWSACVADWKAAFSDFRAAGVKVVPYSLDKQRV